MNVMHVTFITQHSSIMYGSHWCIVVCLFDCSISAYDVQSLAQLWNSIMAKTGI